MELNHVTVIAKNAWNFRGEFFPVTPFCKKNKETVTVMLINSEDP